MEIIFRAFDGKEYHNQEECEAHEKNLMQYKMWDECGPIHEINLARVVYLPTPYAVSRFIKDCCLSGIVDEGIEEKGVYIWDKRSYEWMLLNTTIIQAMQHFLG